MSRLCFRIGFIVALAFIGGQGVAAEAGKVQLRVQHGFASSPAMPAAGWHSYLNAGLNQSVHGPYDIGEEVWIRAHPATPGKVFDRWIGDAHLVVAPYESQTKLALRTRGSHVQATYRDAPEWEPLQGTLNGTDYYYFFPENHRGVVLFLHGAGGNSRFMLRPEPRKLANDLVASGYGVVSVESLNRTNNRWNLQAPTPDVNQVVALLQRLEAEGRLDSNDPMYAVGMSLGGGFSSVLSRILNNQTLTNFRISAQALYAVPGQGFVQESYTTPTMWNLLLHDPTIDTERALQQFEILEARIGPDSAKLNMLYPTPVFPLRFWMPGIMTPDESKEIFVALKEAGFLDDRDFLINNPAQSGWEAYIPQEFDSAINSIASQLTISWTGHEFFSEFNNRTVRFFDAH